MNAMSKHETCPYRSIPAYQRWDKAFTLELAERLDPLAGARPKFAFSKTDAIATAGSCFAQNVSRRLIDYGYNFVQTEKDTRTVFSARYGNIYTVLHLAQLIDRAFGHWAPKTRFL